MQKKDFLIPGTVIVLAIGIGIWLVVRSISPIVAILPPTTATTTPVAPAASSTTATPPKVAGGTPGYYPYGALTLSLNQVAGFKDGLSIRPMAILEDSRCPQGVQCIQAGTVRITLRTTTKTGTTSHDIALSKTITVGNDDITFVSVRPDRVKDVPALAASVYRFTLRVDPHIATAPPDPVTPGPCFVGGCSNEICSDTHKVSSCIYRSEYACYKTATCERQSNGVCGWTQTKELTACLQNPTSL